MEGGHGGARAQSGSNFNPSRISIFCLPLWLFVLLVSCLRSHCLIYDKRMDPMLLSESFVLIVLISYSFRADFCLCCEIDVWIHPGACGYPAGWAPALKRLLLLLLHGVCIPAENQLTMNVRIWFLTLSCVPEVDGSRGGVRVGGGFEPRALTVLSTHGITDLHLWSCVLKPTLCSLLWPC